LSSSKGAVNRLIERVQAALVGSTIHHPKGPDGRGKASLPAFFPYLFAMVELV
jgi:hypothetical protein